jgi:hypothetical protein
MPLVRRCGAAFVVATIIRTKMARSRFGPRTLLFSSDLTAKFDDAYVVVTSTTPLLASSKIALLAGCA